jgi:hypothetical protein
MSMKQRIDFSENYFKTFESSKKSPYTEPIHNESAPQTKQAALVEFNSRRPSKEPKSRVKFNMKSGANRNLKKTVSNMDD